MANEIKNQEFNKYIKQLQSMVGDKQILVLAEKYHNLRVEMSTLTRAVKEKETNLLLNSKKEVIREVKKEEKPSVVSAPVKEEKVEVPQQQEERKPAQQVERNNQNRNNNF